MTNLMLSRFLDFSVAFGFDPRLALATSLPNARH
jgi:hypothetical protein